MAVFSGAIMSFLGLEYKSFGSFILFFVISSIVTYPMNLITETLPKVLLDLDKLSRRQAVLLYLPLDTFATFLGFYIVDCLMPSVSASSFSLVVVSFMFALFGISDIKKSTSIQK